MSERLASKLNLSAGLRQVKADAQTQREFVHRPFEFDLVQVDEDQWLANLRAKIVAGFHPSLPSMADVPKGKGAVRPAALLCLDDRVVYAAAVHAALPVIREALRWSQGVIDCSYQFAQGEQWFRNIFAGWTSFREKSLTKVREGASYVVMTDITGCYENLDVSRLISDLRQLGVDGDIVNLLSTCLNRWSSPVLDGRGIPQGLSASDVLAKVYLNSLDLRMSESEHGFLRYVDDMRLFCSSRASAKKALVQLSQLLRREDLSLQSSKTSMLRSSEAATKIEGITPVIKIVRDRFIKEIIEQTGQINTYLTLAQAEFLFDEQPVEPPVEIVRETFKAYFLDAGAEFDKTLFHFLINRLGRMHDDFAVSYCLSIIPEHPEETANVLEYVTKVGAIERTVRELSEFIQSPDCVYDYQVYQIFKWAGSLPPEATQPFLFMARRVAFDNTRPTYLRSVARMLVGSLGTTADLERIEEAYGSAVDDFDRAQILCCLTRFERSRRNAIVARAQRDGDMCARATKLVRRAQGPVPEPGPTARAAQG